jgi:glutamine cyclotransferase
VNPTIQQTDRTTQTTPGPAASPSRRRFNRHLLGGAALVFAGAGLAGTWILTRPARDVVGKRAKEKGLPVYGFEVVRSFPHDPGAFTQGLVYDNGQFYESTGLEGKSTLRRVEIATGKVLDRHALDDEYFGEGLALVGDELIQLTWKHGIAIVYDKGTLREKRRHRYQGEGWGLTHDGKHLILSDGTPVLRFFDPKTFRFARQVQVTIEGMKLDKLNELEYVNGEVWANIWYEDGIARIDPKSGNVTGWIDLSKLWPQKDRDSAAVLNGIAYDPDGKRIFVTGKNWPKVYLIRLIAP